MRSCGTQKHRVWNNSGGLCLRHLVGVCNDPCLLCTYPCLLIDVSARLCCVLPWRVTIETTGCDPDFIWLVTGLLTFYVIFSKQHFCIKELCK